MTLSRAEHAGLFGGAGYQIVFVLAEYGVLDVSLATLGGEGLFALVGLLVALWFYASERPTRRSSRARRRPVGGESE